MFRIRKYNFHFWKNFPNLRREIAAKNRVEIDAKKDPMKAYILTQGLVPVLTF